MSSLLTRRQIVMATGAAGIAGGFWAARYFGVLRPAAAGAELGVAQAYEQAAQGRVLLVDIRRPDEWRRTGIGVGAMPLDMRRDDFEQALSALVQGDRTRRIALICARGVRSAHLSNRLAQAGFTRILDVPQGMLGSSAGPGWLAQGLPVVVYQEGSE